VAKRSLTSRQLRPGDGPTSTLELGDKLFVRNAKDQLLCAGSLRRRETKSRFSIELCVLQPVDEPRRLVASELASSLTLREPHWAARLAEVSVACALEESQELPHLACRGGWARLLTECHGRQSCRSCDGPPSPPEWRGR